MKNLPLLEFEAGVTHLDAARRTMTLKQFREEAGLTGSEFARKTFGDDVVDHYGHFFRTEYAAFSSAVTDWERRRYFERI